jgi:hypothetical protein
MRSFPIQIGNFDKKMVGYIILEFTYIRFNAKKKIVQKVLSLIISTPSILPSFDERRGIFFSNIFYYNT